MCCSLLSASAADTCKKSQTAMQSGFFAFPDMQHRPSGGHELRQQYAPDGRQLFSAPAKRGARTAQACSSLMNSADNRHPEKVLKRVETFQPCFSDEVDLTVTVFIRFLVDIHTVPAFPEDL